MEHWPAACCKPAQPAGGIVQAERESPLLLAVATQGAFFYAVLMAEASITFNAEQLVGELNALTKVQIPRAARLALNTALFETRKRLQSEAQNKFDKPVPFTVNSFLYQKAEQVGDDLQARVFIRDDAPKGTAPSRYLNPHIRGGPAYRGRFQKALDNIAYRTIDGRLAQAGQRGTLMRPTNSPKVRTPAAKRGARYPSMTGGQYNQILSALRGGVSSADFVGMSSNTTVSQLNQMYVSLDEEALEFDYYKNRFRNYPRKPGIYKVERISNPDPDGPSRLTRYYRVLNQQRIPTYSAKFKFFDLSKEQIGRTFQKEFDRMILR